MYFAASITGLVLTKVGPRHGTFLVKFECSNSYAGIATGSALLNGVPVVDGQDVKLQIEPNYKVKSRNGTLLLLGPDFELVVTCTDPPGTQQPPRCTQLSRQNSDVAKRHSLSDRFPSRARVRTLVSSRGLGS